MIAPKSMSLPAAGSARSVAKFTGPSRQTLISPLRERRDCCDLVVAACNPRAH